MELDRFPNDLWPVNWHGKLAINHLRKPPTTCVWPWYSAEIALMDPEGGSL